MPARRFPTVRQVSAGGVVFRRAVGCSNIEVALICVGPKNRWQLPKGLVDEGESPELTAVREVGEEAGVDAELVAPIEVVEYWYVGADGKGDRVRFHKYVHFFLLEYQGGDVRNHDREVNEARWVPLAEAEQMLAFASERKIMSRAREMLQP